MAESYLSTIWYRVADLRPRLRSHVKVHRHRYRGHPWYVLHDHASGRVHRFTPAAYMIIGQLDGGRTVDEVWRGIAETLDEDAPGQDEVIKLLSRLHQNDLIQYAGTPDVADLLERYDRQAMQVVKQNLTNPMAFRIPLWDPDPFLRRTLPAVRWLTGRWGLLLWLVVVAAGLLTAALEWDGLTTNLVDRLLAAQNIFIALISYPLLKALHELAHGYLARARGAEVREMGIMFLVFFPVPYVDASAASAFRNKWDRAAVAAGGIFVETFVAALALMVWAAAEPGLVRAVAFNLVMVGGLSTILVNANPLLKFDGYYVMADLLEIPNLAQRSNKYWGHIIQRHVFRARQLREEVATPGEKVWFLLYAPAAFVYRIIVMLGIALFVAQKFFVIGILLALWSIFNAVIKPAFKALRHVVTSPQLRKVRRPANLITFGTIGVVLMALLLVPLPLRTDTEGVVWLPDAAQVRAGAPGFVATLETDAGASVTQAAVVARLEDPAARARLAALEWRVEESRRRLAAVEVAERSRTEVARLELADAQAELARAREQASERTLRAGLSGTFEPAMPISEMRTRYLAEGDLLGYVLPEGRRHIRAVVPQADITLVRDRLRGVAVKRIDHLATRGDSAVLRAVPQATTALPSPVLAASGGGRIATDPADAQAMTALAPVFVLDLLLPDDMQDTAFGTRILVRFDHGLEPAGAQIWRRVRQLFLSQFDA